MKKFKRVLATLLMLVMLMQPFAMAASVTEFLDFPNDWSTEAMTAAVENGLLIGNGNKLIEPGRNLRRSELAAIITRAFGATITADIGHFDDVKPGDWYYNAVSEAVQMGAMNGTGPNTFHPYKSVTREEVFTTLARVLCIEGTDMSVLNRFSDADKISDWALASVIGLVENGYIDGYPDGTLNPKGDMTRAELAQLFHNLFKTYIDTSGYHTHVAAEGSVIVRAPGAHLENDTINGDLIIADGVGVGNFDLNSVTVNGRILARGGEGTVTFKKVTATENVVIFDRNGTVNFNNYRTDVPFKDNLVEYTPATFLTKKPVVVPGSTGSGSSTGGPVTRYNVYFYVDGRIYDSVSVKSGNTVAAPRKEPEKAGYTFVYWSEDKNDDGTGEGFDFSTPIKSTKKLYAIFTKDAVEYEITFDLGDGTTKVVTIGEGEKIDEADVPVIEDTDTQYFKGWETPDGEKIPADSVKDYSFDEDTVLTPWYVDKDKKVVIFYNESTAHETQEIPVGGKATKPATDPEKDGAEFKHWGTAPDAEEAFDFENEVITDDTKLYAVYEYTVKFDGDVYPEIKVIHGKKIANPGVAPEVTGKTFAHWSKTDGGTAYDFDTAVTESFTLYAVYSTNKYEITVDGGTPFEVEHGSTIPADKIPEKNDTETQYFKGWTVTYEDGTSENIPADEIDDYRVTKPATITPWYVDKDKKVVTFYNGSTTHETQEIPVGGKATKPAADPEKDGAEFKHWGVSEDAEEAFDFENTPITDETKLYAVYEYTVSFPGTSFADQKVIHGKTVSNPGDAEEEGKTFKHWSLTVSGDAYDFGTKVTESFKLYAVYSTNKYEITVDGGTPFEVEHGSTIPADKIPEKNDTETQYFKGWTVTYEDGTSENIPDDEIDDYKVTKPATITPWYVDKEKKVVTFYNGSTTHETQEIPVGGKATKPATDPEKDGAEFKHWGVSEDAEEAFDFENTTITDETKLYAVYEYTVSFPGTSFADQKVIHGKTVSNPGDAEEEGKTFKHWSLTANGDAYDFGTKVTESFKLYAVFTDIPATEYTITFIVNGSEVARSTVVEGNTVTEPAAPTAPAGKKFSHWAVDTPDGAKVYDFATPVYSDIELYAVFVPVTTEKFDVVFKVEGTEVHSEKVTDGGYAAGPATDPEETEKKYFAGWIVEGDTTETVVDLATYAITTNTVFVALFKNKLAVTFYDLSIDEDPLFTAYVMPGETLADNQYPHHEDNLGDYILDLGEMYEGFERNYGIHSVYDGVEYVHTVPMSYWYLADESDTEWTVFDSNVVINEDTDVHLNVQEVTVTIDIPKLSATFALTLWAPYSGSTRVIDTVKDAIFISEETVLRGIGTVEDDIMGKLIEKGIIDEDYNIKNIHKHITLVQILGKDNINKYIWEFVGDNASSDDVEKEEQKKAYVNQLVDELCAGGKVTVTVDRLFMFEPIYDKLNKFNYEFVESKVPEQLKQILPMEHIEKLFTRFYDDATYGYATQLKNAMDTVMSNPEEVVYIDSGITIMINPISDIFNPALEYALDMKGLAEGKLADKFPTYYTYYKANPYTDALEDYLTTDTWFDGTDAGFEGELSGYSLKGFDEYYDIIKAVAVLTDDAILYYYNDVPEADRDAVLDVAFTKMFDIANIVKGLLVDYATNGVPTSLEEFILSIEDDPKLVEYLEKFGVDAYLDKIAGNENADKVYDTAFDKLMGKFGDRVEALLTKFADSKLNRDYDEGEYNKALEVLNALFTTEEGEEIYTVDSIFEDYLDGVFYKEISVKVATVSVERDYLTNVDDVE